MAGDIVTVVSGLRTSRQKHHVVDMFVSPIHTGVERMAPEGVAGWNARREQARIAKHALRAGKAAKALAEVETERAKAEEEKAQAVEKVEAKRQRETAKRERRAARTKA